MGISPLIRAGDGTSLERSSPRSGHSERPVARPPALVGRELSAGTVRGVDLASRLAVGCPGVVTAEASPIPRLPGLAPVRGVGRVAGGPSTALPVAVPSSSSGAPAPLDLPRAARRLAGWRCMRSRGTILTRGDTATPFGELSASSQVSKGKDSSPEPPEGRGSAPPGTGPPSPCARIHYGAGHDTPPPGLRSLPLCVHTHHMPCTTTHVLPVTGVVPCHAHGPEPRCRGPHTHTVAGDEAVPAARCRWAPPCCPIRSRSGAEPVFDPGVFLDGHATGRVPPATHRIRSGTARRAGVPYPSLCRLPARPLDRRG